MKRILIIEDETVSRVYTHRLLKRKGFECIEAANAEEALSQVESSTFDLILLDLGLPDLSGFALMEKFREIPISTDVIAVTGRDSKEDISSLKELGVKGFVAKPVQEWVFFSEIDRVLGEKGEG